MENQKQSTRLLSLAVIVSALGYFVDIFDLYLFGVVRVSSLKEMGLQGDQLLEVGVSLLNHQMLGVLLGGIFWGVLGDKIGRVSVLFGSIFLYSAANLANAFVHSVETYSVLRFIAGFGLAGELGLAITLVSEVLPKAKRGYGTTIVAGVGLSGAVGAAVISEIFHWRTSFIIGGVLGFILLALRFKLHESDLYRSMKSSTVRGDFRMIFTKKERFLRYLCLILVGVPIWVTVGIGVTFSPEFAQALGVTGPVTAGKAIFCTYIGVAVGDFASGIWSQKIKSRKKVLAVFLSLLALFQMIYLCSAGVSPEFFYAVSMCLGFATGYWAVFMTTAAEQFGTNLRSTVTTSVPNFVRGSVVPATLLFNMLKPQIGLLPSMGLISGLAILLGYFAIYTLKESYDRDLDFLES